MEGLAGIRVLLHENNYFFPCWYEDKKLNFISAAANLETSPSSRPPQETQRFLENEDQDIKEFRSKSSNYVLSLSLDEPVGSLLESEAEPKPEPDSDSDPSESE